MQHLTSKGKSIKKTAVWQGYDYDDNIIITTTWPNPIQSMDEPNPCPTLVWVLAAAWRLVCIHRKWTEWTLAMALPWWQHYKHWH